VVVGVPLHYRNAALFPVSWPDAPSPTDSLTVSRAVVSPVGVWAGRL